MKNIESIYADWLSEKNAKNREKYEDFKGTFSASSAGNCFRKQYLKSKGIDEPALEDRVMRLLRLGTIVHEDIQESLNHYFRHTDTKLKLYIEHQIKIPELNVVGHLDAAIYDKENEHIRLYDIKTSASYKWRMKFGRKREKNGSVNYNLQIGTYAFGLGEELKTTDIDMNLLVNMVHLHLVQESELESYTCVLQPSLLCMYLYPTCQTT